MDRYAEHDIEALEDWARDGMGETMDNVQHDDFLDLDPLSQIVDDITFDLVNVQPPAWYINTEFNALSEQRAAYDSIAACSPPTFALNLLEVLQAPVPPPTQYLTSLPAPSAMVWAVYVVVMAKAGESSELYIGSGTDRDQGVAFRLNHYRLGGSMAPRYVRQAFARGYCVANKGLMCWTPLPTPGMVPRVRRRFFALEALFACLFHATIPAITDAYTSHLLL